MKLANLNLPEFAFLDANCHTGDDLEGRTVINHLRSNSIIEVFDSNDEVALNPEVKTLHYEMVNSLGLAEHLTFAVHFSFAEEVEDILNKTAQWYAEYCRWEDANINNDFNAERN